MRRQKERGQYSAVLTEQAWSIKNLLHALKQNLFFRDQRGKSRAPILKGAMRGEEDVAIASEQIKTLFGQLFNASFFHY